MSWPATAPSDSRLAAGCRTCNGCKVLGKEWQTWLTVSSRIKFQNENLVSLNCLTICPSLCHLPRRERSMIVKMKTRLAYPLLPKQTWQTRPFSFCHSFPYTLQTPCRAMIPLPRLQSSSLTEEGAARPGRRAASGIPASPTTSTSSPASRRPRRPSLPRAPEERSRRSTTGKRRS